MDNEPNKEWRYYRIHSGVKTHQIIRCPENDLPITSQNPKDVQAFIAGNCWEYRENVYRVMMNDYLTGWFDEEDDKISENELDQVLSALAKSRATSKRI